jgi:glucose/arabinose dehydrogenase
MIRRQFQLLAAVALTLAAVPAAALPFRVQQIATLDNPWGMAFLPDGRALITEKRGQIRLLRLNGQLSAPLPGVPAVKYEGQLGLLDVVIAPTFATTQRIYFTFVQATDGSNSRLALAEARLVNERLENVVVIWRAGPSTTGGHPGGRIAITSDSSLYVTTGDRQQFTPAQEGLQSWGKIVKVNRLGQARNGNPFLGNPAYLPEIWTLGHRNPYGIAWDAARGTMWSHEHGPAGGDEVNVVQRGRNYGWPLVSEGDHYDGRSIPRHSTRPDFVAPAYAWPQTFAPSGLMVYRGGLFPGWRGSLFAGGLAGQALMRFTASGKGFAAAITGSERFDMGARIRDVEQSPDGAIWVLTDGGSGKLLKLTPAS